ncbi:MAG: hypothetical protein WAM60_12620 [Candidatus Promineifilaceae bacterium]
MEKNRKLVIAVGIPFLGMLIAFAIIAVWLDAIPQSFLWPGCLLGFGAGIPISVYLALSWDPVNLRPKYTNANITDSRWLTIVVIGSFIAGRVILGMLNEEIGALVAGCMLFGGVWAIAYIIFQVWWYRPKN